MKTGLNGRPARPPPPTAAPSGSALDVPQRLALTALLDDRQPQAG